MSVQAVIEFFNQRKKPVEILTFEDTSTVAKAAESLGVTHGEIAKSLLFKVKDDYIMIVMAGDKRLDNRKFKDVFQTKAKMPEVDEVMAVTGHPVGGVCPFGLKQPVPIYLDKSLQVYERVFPAAGETNAAVELKVDELKDITGGQWVDVSKD
ncbi:YbaK/EbsC family protein [Desulforamulus putei]|uniref:Cys-tRNA(Pro) deacylase, prolyl-tRNA editing enzyme YbaK/EbsC n=1 Tax=Desulforamulus putei DSM 12395 TaxID=1121429 RepID=A0A1M4Y181_9FIRM|nr:YbaK/EbsC family protein [Desulforamulus putei]SHE99333.1 Cys-tRNA(Pro) deacylase, prolyl-tRNA editing enzyme YbaK/EbsC [Desulforamulus putei DSM 12395]